MLTPYTKSKKLSFEDAQKTFQVTYTGSVLKTERDGKKTTGLDAAAIRDASGIDPQLPIPSTSIDRLSLDVEGMVANADGSYVQFTITAMITSMTPSIGFGSATSTGRTSTS